MATELQLANSMSMTKTKEKLPFEKVAQNIVPQAELLRTWPLAGGISATMTALEVAELDGQRRRMVVRHYEGMQQRADALVGEYRLLQILRSLGLAVPEPYYLDCSGELLQAPYMVIEYIEGAMDFAPRDVHRHVLQMARCLAEIHRVDRAAYDLSFLHESAAACVEIQGPQPVELAEFFGEGRIREALAAVGTLPVCNEPVLLHGDFWPGNTLWRAGELVAVIDWEDAELGDPLMDLAKARAEIAWIFGIDALHGFTDEYRALVQVDYAALPYWDLCATLRFLRFARPGLGDMAEFFVPYGRADITEQTIRDDLRYFIDQAFAGLDAR